MADRALLLDFDGVIVDSEGTQLLAVNQVLASHGIELSKQEWIERCVGRKARDFLSFYLSDRLEAAEFERLLKAKSIAYRNLARMNSPVARPGIRELIERAIEQGFCCAIVSATPEADIRDVIAQLDLSHLLGTTISSDSVARPKPAPDVYLRAAELLEVASAQCVVVEDTPTGIAAGRAAGMHCVAFPNEWTEALDFSGADLVITTLDDTAIQRSLDLVLPQSFT